MGCDIHVTVEVQQEDGTWYPPLGYTEETYEEGTDNEFISIESHFGYVDRSYNLFGYLTGGQVRADWMEEHALPMQDEIEDPHPETKKWLEADFPKHDGHSFNSVTLDQLEKSAANLMLLGGNYSEQLLPAVKSFINQISEAVGNVPSERVRAIFFFDN